MIRYSLLSMGLMGVTFGGCAAPVDGALLHESTLETGTNGLALHRDGRSGHAGMRGTNCPFDTNTGSVTGDYDLPGSDEEVQDIGVFGPFETAVVLTQPDEVHILDRGNGDYGSDRRDVPGVREVRLSQGDLVAVVSVDDRCEVFWAASDARVETGCGSLEVDVETGTAFVGGDPVVVATPDGTTNTDVSGELIAWDDVAEVLYTSSIGDHQVSAVEQDGSLRWQVDLEGPVHSLSHGGAHGAAVVGWEGADGRGVLSWLDGQTGALLHQDATPTPAPEITVSDNGEVLAVVLSDQAHFYGVRLAQ